MADVVIRERTDEKGWIHRMEIPLKTFLREYDFEAVVRCKDCVYCKRFNDVWYMPKRDELLCTLHVETYHTTENDFCSWGERIENGKEN